MIGQYLSNKTKLVLFIELNFFCNLNVAWKERKNGLLRLQEAARSSDRSDRTKAGQREKEIIKKYNANSGLFRVFLPLLRTPLSH
jgi:hypothetical protein